MKRTRILIALLLSSALAQDMTALPAAARSVDAQAFAFTGRHCQLPVITRPPTRFEPGAFDIFVAVLEAGVKQALTRDVTLRAKSQSNGKNLYLVALSSTVNARMSLIAAYADQNMMYSYKCDLR